MRTNVAIIAVAAVLGAFVMVALWGCGVSPLEQSYAWQTIDPRVEDAGYNVGEKTDVPMIMKQLRTSALNLADRLLYGSPEAVISTAVTINYYADELTKYQPAIALEGMDEAAVWKRLSFEVKDMAVEAAKGIDSGKPDQADSAYVRMFLSCNQCHRLFRRAAPPSSPPQIPEIETPAPAPAPEGTTPPAEGPSGIPPLQN